MSTIPIAASASVSVQSESHLIVRHRTLTLDRQVATVLKRLLGIERETGKVTLNLSQGAITNIQLEESARIT